MIYWLLRRVAYYIQVAWIRFRNRTPERRALIKKMASQEWEQQRMCDFVLGQGNAPYEPGFWWRLRKRTAEVLGQ